MPVLDREEYIEQAYFFHAFRERLIDGLPAQEILARVGEELLSTTRLPLAVSFLTGEIKGAGLMGPGMERLSHYFTPFQTHVVNQAEGDVHRFSMDQALLILEREAKFRAELEDDRRTLVETRSRLAASQATEQRVRAEIPTLEARIAALSR